MKVTFEVKKVDIKNGEVYCRTCPIALALRRVVQSDIEVNVFSKDIDFFKLNSRGERAHYHTVANTLKIKNFIRKFDHGDTVKPTKFQINIPEEYLLAKYTKKKSAN